MQKKEKEDLTDPIVAKAQEAVKKVAQKGAYVAVFNTTIPSMVYYDEAAMTDLSTEVKAEAGDSINGNASTTKSVRFGFRSGRFISSKSPFRAAEIKVQHILPLPTRTPCRRIILARQRLHTQPRPPQ